jgi:hypothetical protein
MRFRVLPVLLLAGAMLADARGLHEASFYLLVAAIPAAALGALSLFGELVDLPGGANGTTRLKLDALLAAVGLLCVLIAAGARGQAPDASTLPALAGSAAVAALAVYGAQTFAALARR